MPPPSPPTSPARTRRLSRAALLLAGIAFPATLAAPAYAADATIDHIEQGKSDLQVVVSLHNVADGATPDLESLKATFDGAPVEATAESLADNADALERTVILTMDVSASMRGAKFEAAKSAAATFLDEVPEGVNVGVVTFASDVEVAQPPTQDLEAVRSVIDSLTLTRKTRLYEGLMQAVTASGDEGARSILLLSDGRDTTPTSISAAVRAVKRSGVKVDVVALAQDSSDTALLQPLADAGNGAVISADDPAALEAVFASEAETLAEQILVTVTPAADSAGKEGTLALSFAVGDSQVSTEAFAGLPAGSAPGSDDTESSGPVRIDPGLQVPVGYMYGGLAAAGVAVMVIILLAMGGLGGPKSDKVDQQIEAYTRKGARKLAEANRAKSGQSGVTQQAVAVAESVLESQKGLENKLGARLDAAGLALKPAEWLLIHAGVALGFGLAGLLLGGGSATMMLLALVLGVFGPWVFLLVKRRRRLAAFAAQLADTLQLMAGSLSAGLSLAQAVDTVVREGADPMASEFRRALVETRLGVDIEDALMGVAERMQSVDFEWVVMAIRIQREVGGNLAELLNKVADTIREREYLLRQVKTLSAEGRLSVWVLGGLPPGFVLYLLVANPTYVNPLFTNPLGWVMCTVMVVLLTVGVFWMKKLVKVEV